MRQKGFIPILILILIALAVVGYFGYKNYWPKMQTLITPTPTMSPNPTTEEKQFCGGIAGVICPEGYSCKLDGDYPDASGVCTKLTEQVSPITSQDLKQGWYWGQKDQKKQGTPADWVFCGNGSRSDSWHKPDISCNLSPD